MVIHKNNHFQGSLERTLQQLKDKYKNLKPELQVSEVKEKVRPIIQP